MLLIYDPQLETMFETDRSRLDIRQQGGLSHHQPDQIIGQQINPDFLSDHFGCFARQDIHLQGFFDISNIQLNLSSTLVE